MRLELVLQLQGEALSVPVQSLQRLWNIVLADVKYLYQTESTLFVLEAALKKGAAQKILMWACPWQKRGHALTYLE